MATYEVFLKRDGKDEFRHAGALDAANDELALVMARESYIRRAEGNKVWVVNRENLIVGDDDFVGPNADKPHRHHDGSAVAARRKAIREDGNVEAIREDGNVGAIREDGNVGAIREEKS